LKFEDLEGKLTNSLGKNKKLPERIQTTIDKINRNISISEKIKSIYESKCQICDVHLKKTEGAIAIGSHIKVLGKPHNGPDTMENMLCLCPNHHAQFDAFSFYIDPEVLDIIGLDKFENKRLRVNNKHKIDKNFLNYHKEQFLERNN